MAGGHESKFYRDRDPCRFDTGSPASPGVAREMLPAGSPTVPAADKRVVLRDDAGTRRSTIDAARDVILSAPAPPAAVHAVPVRRRSPTDNASP